MLLEGSGHQVVTKNGSIAALQQVEQEAPDVILLDIGLPEMDGYELARRLRAREVPGTPLILIAVTGYGHEDDRKMAREAGFDHHLTKPINFAALTHLLTEP